MDVHVKSSDGRYEIITFNENKLIKDNKTGLMWTPDLGIKESDWNKAKAAVQDLNIHHYGDYRDWRLPTREELFSIYDDDNRHHAVGHSDEPWTIGMDPIFGFSGSWAWSSELRDAASAWSFSFHDGAVSWLGSLYAKPSVLAVRSYK